MRGKTKEPPSRSHRRKNKFWDASFLTYIQRVTKVVADPSRFILRSCYPIISALHHLSGCWPNTCGYQPSGRVNAAETSYMTL